LAVLILNLIGLFYFFEFSVPQSARLSSTNMIFTHHFKEGPNQNPLAGIVDSDSAKSGSLRNYLPSEGSISSIAEKSKAFNTDYWVMFPAPSYSPLSS
jgi:hypothetical protein